jgi:hypothetical protein
MSLIVHDIFVDRVDDVLTAFDEIEVHRSIAGEGGPYTEITIDSGPTAAVIDGSTTGPFDLDGLSLEVLIDLNSSPDTINFVGDGLDIDSVISQINAVVAGLASEIPTDTDQLRLSSGSTGTGSTLTVTAGAAATALGLSATKVSGKADRISIVSPTENYTFRDLDGDLSYYYKIRYVSSVSGTTSSFSDPRQGSADTVVAAANLSLAKVYLATAEGKPVVGRRVIFYVQTAIQSAGEDYFSIPGHDGRVVAETNEQGYAQAMLFRNATYRVHIEGASYMREFIVPDLTEFDILPLIGTSPDPFDIVQAPSRPIKVTT